MDNKDKDFDTAASAPDSAPFDNKPKSKDGGSNKKNILLTLLFIFIAGLTVYAITAQSQSFSLDDFIDFVSKANPVWIIAAILGMIAFIVFEGLAIITLCKGFGYKKGFWNGYMYSAGDIYVSAITPSASGGQPASAYFMVRDGIPGSVTTVVLIINVVLYLFSILIVGIVCFIVMPSKILAFSTFSKILIIIGVVLLVFLSLLFILLLKRRNLLKSICRKCIAFLAKIRIIKRPDVYNQKLNDWIRSYRDCARALIGKKSVLLKALLFNILQRISQLLITVFAFLAVGGAVSSAGEIFVMQEMVVIGSNCIPIPGAMGIADFLMIDAFSSILDTSSAINLELLARTISFYLCVLLCGFSFFFKLIRINKRKQKNQV